MDGNKRSNSGSEDIDSVKAKKAKLDIDSNAVSTLASLASSGNRGSDVSPPPPTNSKQEHAPPAAEDGKKDKSEDVPTKTSDPKGKPASEPEIPRTATAPVTSPAAENSKKNEANTPSKETKGKEELSKPQGEDVAFTMSQSERKRFREKQRRQNISGKSMPCKRGLIHA